MAGRLADRIARSGPIPYPEFVEACLYDETHGFYASGGAAGRRGDFLTSPEVGPLFGAVLARWMDDVWEALGQPGGFTVVDAGAGRGTLARAVVAAGPRCLEAGTYLMVERSAVLRADQPSGIGFASSAHLPDGGITGVVVANELLDNLPFGLLAADGDRWRSVRVGLEADQLVEVLAEECLPPVDIAPVPGARIPDQGSAAAWTAGALESLDFGALLVVDYTSTTTEMATRPVDQWLRTYRGHQQGGRPVDDPGSQDITVEVAVDQLPEPTSTTDQATFLVAHGIDDLVAEGRQTWTEQATTGDLAAVRGRSRIVEAEALRDPTGLGGFTTLEWRVGC